MTPLLHLLRFVVPTWQPPRRGVSRREAAGVIARLAALTAAGVAVGEAVASSARSGQRLAVLVHGAVRRGAGLSTALADPRLPFAEAEVALVRAGERGGSTPRALALLAERMERESGGRRRIASALAYPVLLASGGVAALCFLSIVVLPSFTSLYAGQNVELPWATQNLLRFGQLAQRWAPGLLTALACVVALALVARRRSRTLAMFWDRFCLDAEPLRRLTAPRVGHEACALMALLLEAGCEAEEALALTSRATVNRVAASRITEALRSLRHGVPLSRAWKGAGLDRSGDAATLLEIAEATGGYAPAFARIATLEGQAADRALAAACRVAEPAAVIVMAFAVGGGVLALYQPMLGSASLLLGGNP